MRCFILSEWKRYILYFKRDRGPQITTRQVEDPRFKRNKFHDVSGRFHMILPKRHCRKFNIWLLNQRGTRGVESVLKSSCPAVRDRTWSIFWSDRVRACTDSGDWRGRWSWIFRVFRRRPPSSARRSTRRARANVYDVQGVSKVLYRSK